jgi:flavin-dependent dehydrogenase
MSKHSHEDQTNEAPRRCDHTLYLTDQQGRRCGSWVDELKDGRVRVGCGVCGKLYG